jgi:Fe2+ or Zn2+ uptake regulation protein
MIHAKVEDEDRFEINPEGETFKLQCDECGRIRAFAVCLEPSGNIGIVTTVKQAEEINGTVFVV